MSLQNPIVPAITDAIEIDAVILDLQTRLNNSLPWLTHAYGRAYQLLDETRTNAGRLYLPEIYIGKDRGNAKYFDAQPDNDKQGQCLFFVEREEAIAPQVGLYGWLRYNVSIIFSANLDLINSALLETELFTTHLVADVRNVLIRQQLGTFYRLTYNNTQLVASDVWQGFDIELKRVEKAPMQHFKMNFTVQVEEDCVGLPYDSCSTLLSKLDSSTRNSCILPTYDFSKNSTLLSLTAQQESDLRAYLCTPTTPVDKSMYFELMVPTGYITTGVQPVYDFEYNTPFTLSCWVKLDNLSTFSRNVFNHYTTSGADRGYFLAIFQDGRVRMDLQHDGGFRRLSVSSPINTIQPNAWYNITVTYSGSPTLAGLNIYVNGVLTAKENTAATLGSRTIKQPLLPLFIGASMNDGNSIGGLISDFRIWSSELTEVEVLAEFNAKGRQNPVSANSLIGWCKCGDEAVYGVDTWTLKDFSETVSGYKTMNIPANALSNDVPI